MKDDLTSIIIQADMAEVQAAQDMAELRNAMIRHQERMAKYTAWVDPKEMAARKKRHEEEAAKALERGKAMGLGRKLLPVPDPLPQEMAGQSASTIQAMLRNGWKPEPL